MTRVIVRAPEVGGDRVVSRKRPKPFHQGSVRLLVECGHAARVNPITFKGRRCYLKGRRSPIDFGGGRAVPELPMEDRALGHGGKGLMSGRTGKLHEGVTADIVPCSHSEAVEDEGVRGRGEERQDIATT